MVLLFMSFTLLAKCLGIGIESTERAHQILLASAKLAPAGAQRDGIRRLFRTEAAVAAARIGRADSTASSVGYRSQARYTPRHHHTDGAALFALHTDTM